MCRRRAAVVLQRSKEWICVYLIGNAVQKSAAAIARKVVALRGIDIRSTQQTRREVGWRVVRKYRVAKPRGGCISRRRGCQNPTAEICCRIVGDRTVRDLDNAVRTRSLIENRSAETTAVVATERAINDPQGCSGVSFVIYRTRLRIGRVVAERTTAKHTIPAEQKNRPSAKPGSIIGKMHVR